MRDDIIVIGSDGVWSNANNGDLIDCIYPFVENSNEILDLELVAEIIVKFAKNNAEST